MKYILTVVVMIFFVGCSCKKDVIVKYKKEKVEIPSSAFECPDVKDYVITPRSDLEEWLGHLGHLKSSYRVCKNKLDNLRGYYDGE